MTTPVTFINTTPHTINLKFSEDRYEVKPSDDKSIIALFRGNTKVSQKKQPLQTEFGVINVTGVPEYSIDEKEFNRLVTGGLKTKVYLISTISAEMLRKSSIVCPDNTFFMVPYSGPDQDKCRRVDGQIKWVAELMDYTK